MLEIFGRLFVGLYTATIFYDEINNLWELVPIFFFYMNTFYEPA